MYRILVVDDEPHIRSGLEAKVQQYGNDLLIVSGKSANGTNALEWLNSSFADICITDIRMPVMDGLELVKQINEKFSWVKCVIVSSYDDFSYAQQAIGMNVSDYILKPVERETLHRALENAISALEKSRMDRANQLLVDKMQRTRDMLSRWTELILTHQFDKYPLLVFDTLEMMEDWIQGDYYLLDALSAAWIQMVEKEVKRDVVTKVDIRDDELGFDSKSLPNDNARFYFRLVAIIRLEKSILQIFDQLKKSSQFENAKMINQVKQYIDLHYSDKFTTEDLADAIPISRSYLAVLFKQNTGQTVWSYLVEVRMKNAKLLLLDQKLKIYEIAHQLGYENSEHFSKLFKEYYGVTPKDYRRKIEMNVDIEEQ